MDLALNSLQMLICHKIGPTNHPCLNRGLSSNPWWLTSTNHVQLTEECMMCTEKHVLVKKIFTNELNIVLPLWAWVKKTVYGAEIHWLLRKGKVLGTLASKEGHADSFFWNMKGPITIDFLEINNCWGCTINNKGNCGISGGLVSVKDSHIISIMITLRVQIFKFLCN